MGATIGSVALWNFFSLPPVALFLPVRRTHFFGTRGIFLVIATHFGSDRRGRIVYESLYFGGTKSGGPTPHTRVKAKGFKLRHYPTISCRRSREERSRQQSQLSKSKRV